MNQSILKFFFWATIIVPVPDIQSQQTQNPALVSSPTALQAVRKSLNAMGGEGLWKSIQAASVTVTVSKRDLPSRQVTWYDDWHKSTYRYRREASDASGHKRIVIDAGRVQSRLADGKSLRSTPTISGIVVLSENYPGAALTLALHRPDCSFQDGQLRVAEDVGDDSAVNEICNETSYPGGRVSVRWIFSKSTQLPKRIEVPSFDLISHKLLLKTIVFIKYQSANGILLPSQIQTEGPGSETMITLSQPTFSTELPDALFNPSRWVIN